MKNDSGMGTVTGGYEINIKPAMEAFEAMQKLTLTTEGSIPSTTAISEQFVNGHWRVSARDTYTLHYDTPEPKKTRTVKPLSKRLKKLGIKV